MKQLIKQLLSKKGLTYTEINEFKKQYADKHKDKLPLNSEILSAATAEQREKLITFLKTKPTRTISGVSIIAIMTAPKPCPGKCIYCPQGDNAPKSYTGFEPAAMRAQLNNFDAYKQFFERAMCLFINGHNIDKEFFKDPEKFTEKYPLDMEGLTKNSIIIAHDQEAVIEYGMIPFFILDNGKLTNNSVNLNNINRNNNIVNNARPAAINSAVITGL